MSEAIENKFGLDASAALQALTQLDSGFAKLSANLASSASSFTEFNSNAGRTVAALIQIRDRANEAADALGRLNKVPRPPSVSGGGLPGVGGSDASAGLLTGSAAAAQFNQLLGGTTPAVQQTAQAMNAGATATANYGANFDRLVRVLQTQLVVRALNQLRDAVEDSVGGFIKFSTAIAQIQTISTDETFGQLADQVRKLSDEFNVPILDVAKAKYEALSNGFDTAETSTTLLTAALKFSKVGIATTAQSMDLLSGALNAFGQDAGQAETLAGKLFETIRLGKVVGSELATAFGRVAPIGKEIGASQDELLAAFSSITIGGVKASEAATQIRATLASLLKPSTDMAEALHKLGFESGEQAIGALGFQGALQALIGTTNGSITAISGLFPNIRAIGGVLRETTTGVDIFQDHLAKIKAASSGLLNQKYDVFIKTNANEVETDMHKLKNFFTVDLGEQLTNKLHDAFSTVGIENVIHLMQQLVPDILLGVAALTAFAAATSIASVATGLLSANLYTLDAAGKSVWSANAASIALKGTLLGIGALLISYDLGKAFGQHLVDEIEAPQKALEKTQATFQAFQDQKRSAANNLDDQTETAQAQQLHKYNAAARLSFFQEVDDAKEANQKTLDESKSSIDKLIGIRSRFATDLQRSATTAENDITSSKKRNVDLQGQLEDRQFNQRLNNLYAYNTKSSEYARSEAEQSRALFLARDAASKLGKANTPDQKEAGENEFKRAEAYAEQALQTAKTSGNLIQQQDAERVIQSIIRQKIDAETQYQATRKAAADAEEAGAAKERDRVTKLRAAEKDFLDNAAVTNSKGDLLSDTDRAANKQKALAALTEIKNLLFGPDAKSSFGDLLSFDKLQKDFKQGITGKEVEALFKTTPENLNSVHKQLQGSIDTYGPILLKFAPDPNSLLKLPVNKWFDDFDKQVNERTARDSKLRVVGAQEQALTQKLNDALAAGEHAINQQKTRSEAFFNGGPPTTGQPTNDPDIDNDPHFQAKQKIGDEYYAIRQKISDLFKNPDEITSGLVASLQKRFSEVKDNKENIGFGLEGGRTDLAIAKLKEYIELQEKRNTLEQQFPAHSTELNDNKEKTGNDSFEAFSANLEKDKADAAKKAAEAAAAAVPAYQSQADASARTAANAERAAAASAAAAKAGLYYPANATVTDFGSGDKQTRAPSSFSTGGNVPMQYFDSGGATKGIDTIPSMLAPHEVVMNQGASAKWFSTLQAMNAGVNPQAQRSQSGDTFQIGDINISESGDAKATAREVINQIRREQRRGSGYSLNNG